VTLTQTQAGDPYRFPLAIGIAQSAAAPPRVQRVNVTGRESTFTVPSDGEPASVTLDPDVWLLADFGTFTRATAASREPDAQTAHDLSRRSQGHKDH